MSNEFIFAWSNDKLITTEILGFQKFHLVTRSSAFHRLLGLPYPFLWVQHTTQEIQSTSGFNQPRRESDARGRASQSLGKGWVSTWGLKVILTDVKDFSIRSCVVSRLTCFDTSKNIQYGKLGWVTFAVDWCFGAIFAALIEMDEICYPTNYLDSIVSSIAKPVLPSSSYGILKNGQRISIFCKSYLAASLDQSEAWKLAVGIVRPRATVSH